MSRADVPAVIANTINETARGDPEALVLRFSHLIQLICLRIAGPAVSS